jgi:hypothetical protein
LPENQFCPKTNLPENQFARKRKIRPNQKFAGNSNFITVEIFIKKSRGKATGFFYKGQWPIAKG